MKNHMNTLKIGALGTMVAVAVLAGCDRPEQETSSTTVTTPPPATSSPAPGTSGYVGPGESSSSSSSTMSAPPATTDTAPGSSSSSTSGGPGQSDTATPGTSGYVGGAAETPPGATTTEEQQRQNQSGTGGSSNMSPSGTGPNSSLDQRPFRDVAVDGDGVTGPAAWRDLFGVQAIRVADDKSAQTGTDSTMGKMQGSEQSGMKFSKKDRKFINEAAAGGMFEVEAARLAAEKATDPQVKSFAAKLLDQHQQANEELKQIASNKGVTLPTQLPSKERAMIDRLSKTASDKFDQEFLKTVGLKDHKEDIRQFENASKETSDPELKAWIDKTLPALRTHLAEAQTMSGHAGMKMQGYMGTEKEGKPGSGMTGGAAGESGKQGGGGY